MTRVARQNESYQNVVAGGAQIADGAGHLSGVSQNVAAQFKSGGSFKKGMEQLAGGASKLKQSTGSFSSLQQGINNLPDGLFRLNRGAKQILTGSENLQSGKTKRECSR